MTKPTSYTKEIFIYKSCDNVSEYHAMLHVTDCTLTFDKQLDELCDMYKSMMNNELKDASPLFVRYFMSDAANQEAKVKERAKELHFCATSIIEQPPLDGTKVAMWVYAVDSASARAIDDNTFVYEHGGYRHLWSGSMSTVGNGSRTQTRTLFENYIDILKKEQCTLADNCMRTWFYVRDIDINYSGVVDGRNEVFACNGLTKESHSISSTGIGGRNADKERPVQMDAYSIAGIDKEQIRFLYAPTHLNPTHEYGVSFERGTCIEYGDRRHVIISGTASIDNKGAVVHVGDIRRQTMRMWENVEVLLKEADCDYGNVGQMIVYLRDIADFHTVKKMYDERFPETPKVFLLAPVCRPEWLIEMECIAIKATKNNYNKF